MGRNEMNSLRNQRWVSIGIAVAFAALVVSVGVATHGGDEGSVRTAEAGFDRPATEDDAGWVIDRSGTWRSDNTAQFSVGLAALSELDDAGPGDEGIMIPLPVYVGPGIEQVEFGRLPGAWRFDDHDEVRRFVVIWECDTVSRNCGLLREWITCAGVCSDAWTESEFSRIRDLYGEESVNAE